MISFFRRVIAVFLWGVVTVLTFGRVQVDRTGKTGGEDDPRRLHRPAISREHDDAHHPDELEAEPLPACLRDLRAAYFDE